MTHGMKTRRGYVLLVVLWTLVIVASLGLAASLGAREAVGTATNRVSLARAAWAADGCLAAAEAAAAEALGGPEGQSAWRELDRTIAAAPLLQGAPCAMHVRAAGAALDVNRADAEELDRLFRALDLPVWRRDSIVDAVLDWRDADDEPRAHGAERQWYAERHRFLPRNGPFAAPMELARVRGLDSLSGLDSLLDVDPVRIPLGRAPLPVLAALPGFTPEAVDRVAELRARGVQAFELMELIGMLSPLARDTMAVHYSEVAPRVTSEPDAWIIAARAESGTPAVAATVEARFVRAGTRLALIRRRTWP